MVVKFMTVAEKENQEDLKMLFDHLDVLIKNKEKILKNPLYYKIRIQGTGITAMYFSAPTVYLGDLIQLWENFPWKDGNRYYYHVGGSPLSGMSFCRYWEKGKGFQVVKNKPSFGTLAQPAMRMIHNVPNDCPMIPVSFEKEPMQNSSLSIGELVDILTQS